MAALARLQNADKDAEGNHRKGCLILFCGILGLFVVGASTSSNPERSPLVTATLVGLMLLSVVGLVRILASGRDYEDARYQLLMRIHKFLSLDGMPHGIFSYELDFRSYTDRVFFLRKEPFGTKGFFGFKVPYGDISYYSMPLMTGRLKLKNGVSLAFQICRDSAVKTVTKRGYSGKIKTKSKTKARDIFRVRAKLPANWGPAPLEPPSRSGAIVPSYKANGPNAVAVHVVKHVQGTVPDGNQLLQTMAWLFFQLQASKNPK